MRKLVSLIAFLLLAVTAFSQAPQKMSYQAVIRNGSNTLVTSSAIGMRVSILQGSISGTEVYKETYSPNPQTNANGLVTIEIGSGIPVVGSFTTIDWSAGPYFIKTETDPLGGTNYTITGTSQLLSVPYALYSKTAESISVGSAITGATKTKITYAANGLVTDGADATTADIAASTDKNYVTDAQQTVISNTSGTNSGDAAANPTSNTYADSKVADVITDGVTTVAPSQNAVFHALAVKEGSLTFGSGLTRTVNAVANDLITGHTGGQTIIGGTAVGDGLTYKSTTGAGTPTGIAHQWLGGTNGGTVLGTMLNNGNTGIGTTTPSAKLDVQSGNININTNGTNALFSTFTGANSNGYNLFIGGGGLSSIGEGGNTHYGSANTSLGLDALLNNTTGFSNLAVGYVALRDNTTGSINTAVGTDALMFNTTGSNNTAVGQDVLHENTTGSFNTAVAVDALYHNTTGSDNTAVGFDALFVNTTGNTNTAIGHAALISAITASDNTAIGFSALHENTTGHTNTVSGRDAMWRNIIGNYNTTQGSEALYNLTSGDNNVAIGYQSGKYLADGSTPQTTSNNSVLLGTNARASADGNTNEIAIGYNAIGIGSNTAIFGNNSTVSTRLMGNVGIGKTPTVLLDVLRASAPGSVTARIRNETVGNAGYGLIIESEATPATSYALILRNLAGSTIYGGVSTAAGQVGYWGIGASPAGSLGSRLTVNGGASIGSSYIATAAPTDGMIIQGTTGIGYTSGTEITNNKLAVNGTGYFNGTVDATGYKLSGIATFLNPFRTGYAGTAGQILTSSGASTTPVWNNLSALNIPTMSDLTTYADGKVTDVITDGVTTVAPSQNAVFDALAVKEGFLTFGSGLTRTVNAVTNNLITGLTGGQTIIGGTAIGDGLTYKSTTGAGTPTGIAHQWLGGTNGGTVLETMLNNGNIGIGTATPNSKLHLYTTGTSLSTTWEKSNTYAVLAGINSSNVAYFGSANATPVNIFSNGTTGIYLATSGNIGIGYSTGTAITNNKLAVNGAGYFSSTVDATDYKLSGISVFLNPFRTGYAGTSGQILTSSGASTTPVWNNLSALNIPTMSGLTTNTLTKWNGTNLVSVTDGTNGQFLKTDGSGEYSFATLPASYNSAATFDPSTRIFSVVDGGGTVSDTIPLAGVTDGLLSSADKTKLNSIASGAEVNVNADWNALSGDAQILNKPTTLAGYGITDGALSNHNHTVDGLSNVTITNNTPGEILKWNGSAWINSTLAEAGIQTNGSYEVTTNKENTTADNSTTKYPTVNLLKTYTDGKVADAIIDGVITVAPSQNAVFDALALKAPVVTPVFTTNITTPLIVGGTAADSRITYKSTTGAGTPTGIAHQWLGGTNGGTVLGTMLNNGKIGIGTLTPTSLLHLYTTGSSLETSWQKSNTYAVRAGINSSNVAYFGSSNATPVNIFSNSTTGIYLATTGNVGIGYSSGTEITNNKLAVNGTGYFNGAVDATGYKLSGIVTFLNPFRTGYAGTSGQILTSSGASATPVWNSLSALNIPTMSGLTTNKLIKWNGSAITAAVAGTDYLTPTDIAVREVADEFTATASQTAFTLTQTPSANSKVKMYINGFRISNTAYSIIGTALTYHPANNGSYTLVNGDRIQFDYYY